MYYACDFVSCRKFWRVSSVSMDRDRKVWIPSAVEGWALAKVLNEEGDNLVVYNEVENEVQP